LVPPEGGPTELPVPSPTESNAIDKPQDLAFDPNSGDLVIAGENREGHFVLQRIHTSGSGEIGPRYTESGGVIDPSAVRLAIAVGPHGTTYVLRSKGAESGAQSTRAYTVAADFSGTATAVPGFAEAAEEEGWGTPAEIFRSSEGGVAFGSQVAISPDGGTLYWKERFSGVPSGSTEPGSYLVRGYSLADGHTGVLYGGEEVEEECTIQTSTAALAPGGEDAK